MVVEGLGSQGGMQLTGLAVHARTVVVVDAVGDVAGLLDLGQQDATTDGMNSTGREVEDVASLYGVVGQDFGDGAVLHTLLVFVGRYLLLETSIEVGSLVGTDDIPHLALAHLAVLTLCHLIVGVYLDAQVFLSVDELDQEGHLAVIALANGLTQNLLRVFLNDRDQVPTLPLAIADDAGT